MDINDYLSPEDIYTTIVDCSECHGEGFIFGTDEYCPEGGCYACCVPCEKCDSLGCVKEEPFNGT